MPTLYLPASGIEVLFPRSLQAIELPRSTRVMISAGFSTA